MEQSKLAMGDFQRTQMGWANQTRILSEQWKEFMTILGVGFMQVALPILQGINQIIGAMIRMAKVMSAVMSGLFGKQAEETKEVAQASLEAASGETALAGGIKKAGAEAKKAIAGFDDLNVLQTSLASGVDGGDINTDIPVIPNAPKGDQTWGDNIKLSPTVQDIMDKIKTWAEQSVALDTLKDAFSRLGYAFDLLWRVSEPLRKVLGDLFLKILESVGTRGIDILSGAFLILAGIMDGISGNIFFFCGLLTGNMQMAVNGIKQTFKGFGEVLEGIFTAVIGEKGVKAIKDFVAKWIPEITAWWNDDVMPWFSSDRWTALWETAKTGMSGGWAGVVAWWNTSGIPLWFNNNVKPYFSAEKWTLAMAGIKTAFATTFKMAINSAILLMNSFITWLNKAMTFSWKAIKVGGIQLAPAGSVQLINIPQIPMLANGGVIPPNSEFMAVLGDQKSGRNIEAPEDLIRQIVREESQSNSTGGDIVLQIDGRTFARLMNPYSSKESNRVGIKLANGGAY
jgi:hypothetical protein